MKQNIEQETKIGELLSGDNEFTSVRVSKNTLGALAKRGKFGDTFENIIQRMIVETEDKLQSNEGIILTEDNKHSKMTLMDFQQAMEYAATPQAEPRIGSLEALRINVERTKT